MLVLCFMPDESNTCSLWGLILWSVSALSHGSLLPSVFSDNWLRTHFSRNSTWRILKSCFWEYSSRSDFCLFLPGVWKFFIFFFVFLPYTYNFSSPNNMSAGLKLGILRGNISPLFHQKQRMKQATISTVSSYTMGF